MATHAVRVDKRGRRPVKLSASHRLYAFAAIELVALIICSRKFTGDGEAFAVIPLSIAGVAYLLAIREFFCNRDFPKHVIVIGLTLAALWQVAFLSIPTGTDDDVRRYVWDGRVQRLGYDPYVVIPSDPAVAALHTNETRTLNNPDVPSPYPAGAELFFRLVTTIHESVFALRVAFTLCHIAVVLVLFDVLRRTGQAAHWILAYAWHPLLATEVMGSGHVDILGVLLLVVSFAALVRRWRLLAAVAFALAVSVKILPIVLLPLYWRRIRIRDALLAVSVFAVLYLPFLGHGRVPTGSLGTYIRSFRFNGPLFEVIERFAPPQIVVGVAAAAGLALAVWFRRESRTVSADAFAWPVAASLMCAPVVYPWYLLWLLPFARSGATAPLIVWTVSIIPTYIVWHLRALGRPWGLPAWVILLEYGSVVVTAMFIFLRRKTESRAQDCSTD